MTPTTSDPLADRVADWAAHMAEQGGSNDELALQGWALREAARRRGASAQHLVETIGQRIGGLPEGEISQQINRATQAWNQLLAELDSTDENFEHVRGQIRDVFFSVLEAFILAEETGEDENLLAQQLFNAIANDLYVFEPMADVAAEVQRSGGGMQLSDLFCTGVAGLFDGEVRVRTSAQQLEVEEFVPISAVVRAAASAKPLTLAAFEKLLAGIPVWYIKWAAQCLTLAVSSKTGQLRATVLAGDQAGSLAASHDLNGWQFRIAHGNDTAATTIADGSATLKLPKQIDPGIFILQIKDPAGEDWVELFGRVEQTRS